MIPSNKKEITKNVETFNCSLTANGKYYLKKKDKSKGAYLVIINTSNDRVCGVYAVADNSYSAEVKGTALAEISDYYTSTNKFTVGVDAIGLYVKFPVAINCNVLVLGSCR